MKTTKRPLKSKAKTETNIPVRETPEYLALRQRVCDICAGATGGVPWEEKDGGEFTVKELIPIYRAIACLLCQGLPMNSRYQFTLSIDTLAKFQNVDSITDYIWLCGARALH